MAMLTTILGSNVGAHVPGPVCSGIRMQIGAAKTEADLRALATDLNPVIGYWDPLNLAALNLWGKGDAATVGFIRHAEIKHGRVAMAAFIGYIVHENGIRWPFPLTPELSMDSFAGLSAPAVWDATPWPAKLQIILFVGFLEAWSETKYVLENEGQAHYMKGGKPGYFPTFDLGMPKSGELLGWGIAHPVPFNLYDPFNVLDAQMDEEKKARLRLVEINNGRLASECSLASYHRLRAHTFKLHQFISCTTPQS